jgi:hypothetical protein
MDAEHGLSVADCIEEESCVRVLKNFCISCTCIMKAMSIAVTCQASRGSALVHKLLTKRSISADAHAEFQLFSQQLWNIDTKFTDF